MTEVATPKASKLGQLSLLQGQFNIVWDSGKADQKPTLDSASASTDGSQTVWNLSLQADMSYRIEKADGSNQYLTGGDAKNRVSFAALDNTNNKQRYYIYKVANSADNTPLWSIQVLGDTDAATATATAGSQNHLYYWIAKTTSISATGVYADSTTNTDANGAMRWIITPVAGAGGTETEPSKPKPETQPAATTSTIKWQVINNTQLTTIPDSIIDLSQQASATKLNNTAIGNGLYSSEMALSLPSPINGLRLNYGPLAGPNNSQVYIRLPLKSLPEGAQKLQIKLAGTADSGYAGSSLHLLDANEAELHQQNLAAARILPLIHLPLKGNLTDYGLQARKVTANAGVSFVADSVRSQVAQFDPAKLGMITIAEGQDAKANLPEKAFTACAWVKQAKVPPNWTSYFGLIQDNGSSEWGWILGTKGNEFTAGLSTVDATALTYLSSGYAVAVNDWVFVAMTYDGQTLSIYVNGKLAKTASKTGNVNYPAKGWFQIGSYKDDDEFYGLDGFMQQVQLFDQALTAAQIEALMKAES